jgi:hypothetical protein
MFRHIAGVERLGGKRGRSVYYELAIANYEAWVLAQRTRGLVDTPGGTTTGRADAAAAESEAGASVTNLDEWIASAGYRTTRKSGR